MVEQEPDYPQHAAGERIERDKKSGASTSRFYPFEVLLAKTNGKWRTLMERQFAAVPQDAWDKLPE